jgi:hypothetical protein
VNCGIFALEGAGWECSDHTAILQLSNNSDRGLQMKKVALALVLVVAGLSLGGCFVGKGKAPAPVITKG